MLIVGFVGRLKRTKLLRSANWHSANWHTEKVGKEALGKLAHKKCRQRGTRQTGTQKKLGRLVRGKLAHSRFRSFFSEPKCSHFIPCPPPPPTPQLHQSKGSKAWALSMLKGMQHVCDGIYSSISLCSERLRAILRWQLSG